MSRKRRRAVLGAAAALGGAALVYLLYSRWRQYGFEWTVFARSYSRLAWGWIAYGYLLILATYWVRAVRWAVMLRPLRPDASTWDLFSATTIGFTALMLLGRPGEIVRPYLIAAKTKVPVSSQLAAWFLERICDLLAVCVIFGFTLTQISSTRPGMGAGLRWTLDFGGGLFAVAATTGVVILWLLRRNPDSVRARLTASLAFLPERHRLRIEKTVEAFVSGMASTRDTSALLRLVLHTVLLWVMIALGFVCLFQAYRLDLSIRNTLIFLGFVCFGSLFQIPGIGGGMQIVSILVLTEIYGYSLELATSIAVMAWIMSFVGIVPIGLALAVREGFSWRKWLQMKEAALEP